MIRVYFNNFDADRIWSVDRGPGTEELNVHFVEIAKLAVTRQDLSKRGSKTEPCCWLQIDCDTFVHAHNDERSGIYI